MATSSWPCSTPRKRCKSRSGSGGRLEQKLTMTLTFTTAVWLWYTAGTVPERCSCPAIWSSYVYRGGLRSGVICGKEMVWPADSKPWCPTLLLGVAAMKKRPGKFYYRAVFNEDATGIPHLAVDGGSGHVPAFHRRATEYSRFCIPNEMICSAMGTFIGLPIPPFSITFFNGEPYF